MVWYVYDVEFRRRASHNLSAKWGNGRSSSTSIHLRASQNLDADPVAAPIIFLMSALYLPVGLRMPLSNPTLATSLTKTVPVLAPPTLTNIGVTSPDAQQPTLMKTTLNPPATEDRPTRHRGQT